MWNLKYDTNLRNKNRLIENRLGLGGGELGSKDWEFGISRCKLSYIEQINKVKGGTSNKEPTCQHGRHKRHRFHPWVRKTPWRRAW